MTGSRRARKSAADTAPIIVAVAEQSGTSPHTLLDAALEAAGFWSVLSSKRASLRRRKDALAIAIKPDLDLFAASAPTGTSPALVEYLITALRAHGYASVTLCDGRNKPDRWLHNRDAFCVPDLIGYHFEAPAGTPYDLAWMDDDPVPMPLDAYDDTPALHVNGAWVRADVRITFAKAKTDEAWGYALTVANLLGLVATTGDATHWNAPDAALHLLRRCPPHFALIDAGVSSHGQAGARLANPIQTDTIIASPDALLADWIGALKMRCDPHLSPLNAQALHAIGLPHAWTQQGSSTPWSCWTNPSPIIIDAVRNRARWPELDRLASAVLQPVDREAFPYRDLIVEQLATAVRDQLQRVTDPRARELVESLLASALGLLATSRESFVGNITKGEVLQSLAPITLDLDHLDLHDVDHTVEIVEAQIRLLDGITPDARGFRFRTVGGHIHFGASRILPIPFDEFVSRVDVSAAIRLMNDYVGGSWRVLARDAAGRPIRQAERNVYLPQPNWTGVFGADVIDVEKLEVASYTADVHRLHWRTIASANDSAESDDGLITFRRAGSGDVEVHIVARQRFRLPGTLAAARIERWPGVHGELVADAYSRFFDGTVSNLRAVHDGRNYRIGRAPALDGVLENGSDLRTQITGAIALVSRLLGWSSPNPALPGVTQPLAIDDLGFAHFAGSHGGSLVTATSRSPMDVCASHELTPLTFFAELGRAVGRDLAAMGISPNGMAVGSH